MASEIDFQLANLRARHVLRKVARSSGNLVLFRFDGDAVLVEDGGKGSGNWGHEGRKGKLGGSAPGGGAHNRISEEGGTYTSFSKKQKKLATPHTASAGELDNLPNNTKVVVDTTFGKYSMVYNAKYGAFIGQDGVEMYPKDIEDSFNGDDNKLQVFIPNEASTNYSKLKQSFDVSLSRMASAKSYAKPQDADNDLRADTGSVWKTLSDKQKKVLRDYTGSDFSSINYSLRKQRGTKENCDRINDMTAANILGKASKSTPPPFPRARQSRTCGCLAELTLKLCPVCLASSLATSEKTKLDLWSENLARMKGSCPAELPLRRVIAMDLTLI